MNYYQQRGEQKLGPMSWPSLVAAARAGSVGASDLIWADGWEEPRRADAIDGLLSGGSRIAPSSKPLGDDALTRAILPVGRSWWAILAGYLGLFALLIVPGPLALIAGIIAVVHIKRNPGKHGMGRAVFAIVMGALATAVLIAAVVSR